MNQLIAFVLAIFLFVSGFTIVATNICDNVNRRVDKQNLNLAGKSVAGHCAYNEEGTLVINEGEYIEDIQKIISDKITGCIFVYGENIRGVDSTGKCVADIPTAGLGEENVISCVNNVLYELIELSSSLENINIACSNDYIRNTLFNNLEEVTVFTITCSERNGEYTYNVVGYCIFSHINI